MQVFYRAATINVGQKMDTILPAWEHETRQSYGHRVFQVAAKAPGDTDTT